MVTGWGPTGDSYSDVIIGSTGYDNGQSDEGRGFVYHGSSSGLNLTPNWTAESDQADAHFGIAVNTAGDVNGDGFADVVVGADWYTNGQSREGRAYVYLGAADVTDTLRTVIRYKYDPLYRLTGAAYSGVYTYTFSYAYDKVGNRTAMTKTITSTLVTTYTYDAANRLATQNGQSIFTWDANGNLLADGSATYAYGLNNLSSPQI